MNHRGVRGPDADLTGAMRPILLGHTLDLDSTVFCRYGEQAGMRLRYIKPRCPEQNVRSEDSPLSLLIEESSPKVLMKL